MVAGTELSRANARGDGLLEPAGPLVGEREICPCLDIGRPSDVP